MAAIGFYLLVPFIYLVSILPFGVLYALSDFFYVILYYVISYRKKVAYTNLRNAFPEKSEADIKLLAKDVYRYTCDLFLETFKVLTISERDMLKHCSLNADSVKLLDKLAAENRSIVLVMGHHGNWEWIGHTLNILAKHQVYAIYKPIKNARFDKLMYNMRSRFGIRLIAMKDTLRTMLSAKEELNATIFIADQAPVPETAYWTTFLNQDTPVFKGTEAIAKKMNYPVVYISARRVKRGYYELQLELLTDKPLETAPGEITELHTKRLERGIIKQPEIWLWSHKRWKHKRLNAISG